jgi:hypothetical protein
MAAATRLFNFISSGFWINPPLAIQSPLREIHRSAASARIVMLVQTGPIIRDQDGIARI